MSKPLNQDALLTHQVESVDHLDKVVDRNGSALDGSDTGTGKTFSAAGLIQKRDRPTLCVVPKIAITSWRLALRHLGTEADVLNWEMLRTGRTDFGWWDHPRTEESARYKCLRCLEEVELEEAGSGCRCNSGCEHSLAKIKKHNYGKFHWHPGIKFLAFDEVHRGNGMKSLNAEMLIAAKRQNIPTLALSATPAASPLHFRGLGYLLGMHELTGDAGFYAWSRGLKCNRHPQFKQWSWLAPKAEQPVIMRQLNRLLFPGFGIRHRADDIPGFPQLRVQANLFDLEGFRKLDELYEEMREALTRHRERKALDADAENPLTKALRCRQEIELLKVPVVTELVHDYLAKNYSVAVFINFSETMVELRQRLGCDCFVDGTQTGDPAKRQAHIDRFQADDERVIVVNSQAGGECCSLHDIRGVYPVVGLVMPPVSARIFRQLVGRLRRHGGKSLALYRVIFAANTMEVQSHRKLASALNNIDALMDSDLVPDNLSDLF